jgi:hypothetical protein
MNSDSESYNYGYWTPETDKKAVYNPAINRHIRQVMASKMTLRDISEGEEIVYRR